MNIKEPIGKKETFKNALPWVSFVSAIFLLTYLNRAMFGPLLGYIETEFTVNHVQSTELLLYISLGYAFSTFLSGFTCSWFKPRHIVSLAITMCGIVLIFMAKTTDFTIFRLLFLLLGFSAGQYFNAGLSTLRSLVIPKDWGKTIAVHELGPNVSFVLGPLLIGFGANAIGWRDTVFAMGCLSCFVGAAFFIKGKGGDYAPQPVSLSGVGKALKDPKIWLFAWLFGLGVGGEFAPFSVLTLFMESELAFSPDKATLLLTTSRLLTPVAVLYGGYITAKFSTKSILIVCCTMNALGMLLMAIHWEPAFIVGIFIQPLATAISFPPIFTLLAESFSAEDQPMLLALTIPVASTLGAGIVPQMLGYFGDTSGFGTGFTVLAVLFALTIFFVYKTVLPSHTDYSTQ